MSTIPSTPATTDPAHDVLRTARRPLEAIFAPRTVAVIGASDQEDNVGRTILWNLISTSFGGMVFPVHPQRQSVLGIKAYPSIATVPAEVDLAVIATPATTVPGIIGECVDAGVKGAIVISAGFREAGPAGIELERQVLAQARRGGMRVLGPNCLGIMRPTRGLNATFASTMARPGNVALISQSGAFCTAILDWSVYDNVGFSAFISVGSMLDIGWGDLIDELGEDPHTQSIIIYMESIGDARSFLSAAREVARSKPIIVLKAGRTASAAKAAASHTGSLVGSDEVLDAAFRRCGVVRVDTIAELFYMAEVFAKQPRPQGPRLTIVTNAGGPGVLATDALIRSGGQLAELMPETLTALDRVLPRHWSHGNPIDILGDADPLRYAKALEVVAKDRNSDGLLVVLTPQSMTHPTEIAEMLKPYAKLPGKPILASWMGGGEIIVGEATLNRANIPTFPYPDTAAKVFTTMWRYTQNLRSLYETPTLAGNGDTPDRATAARVIQTARDAGRTLLTEVESKQLLAAYDLPTVETRIATSPTEAVAHAEAIGYPVAIKLYSSTITHKTDVGGVQLDLASADAVRRAYDAIQTGVRERAGAEHFAGVTVQPMIRSSGYELIVGSSIDPQLGPVLLFGAGGHLVEVERDQALGLPPLTTILARRMMERTRIYTALKGIRGRPPVDLAGLEQLLVRFSQLVVEQRRIKEIDINPLLAAFDPARQPSLLALDARVVLHDADVRDDDLPRPAIRPYPSQYVMRWSLRDGTPVTIRPIRPEDEPLLVTFHQTLSDRSVYLRYFHPMALQTRTTHERLARMCFIDYEREMALVAERERPETGEQEIVAVGRLMKLHGKHEAEFALLIGDQYQGQGIGTALLSQLVRVGRDEHLSRIVAEILPENRGMQHVAEKVGFRLHYQLREQMTHAVIDL
ncbi:MAG TPA: bifunctional acetate--CoA ligase family protein/GNAT family N-acetyltransferase [Herpetosiphonaceae bacterium]